MGEGGRSKAIEGKRRRKRKGVEDVNQYRLVTSTVASLCVITLVTTDLLDTWIQPFIPIGTRREAQNIVHNKVMLPAIIKQTCTKSRSTMQWRPRVHS